MNKKFFSLVVAGAMVATLSANVFATATPVVNPHYHNSVCNADNSHCMANGNHIHNDDCYLDGVSCQSGYYYVNPTSTETTTPSTYAGHHGGGHGRGGGRHCRW